MAARGLAGRGWLSKMGQKLYALTREGRVQVRRLLPEDELDRILDPRAMTEPGIPGKGFTPVGGGG